MDTSWEFCRVCWAREAADIVDDIQVCRVCAGRVQSVASDGEADAIIFPSSDGDTPRRDT